MSQGTYTTSCACKQCGRTAILTVSLVSPNSMGGATASCNSCYRISSYSYTLTNGVFTYLR